MKKLSALLAAALAVVTAATPAIAGDTAKNVILLISDGWSHNHVLATDYYVAGAENAQSYATFPVYTGMSNYMGYWVVDGEAQGKGYHPEGTWQIFGYDGSDAKSNFDYIGEFYTDSAAAVTAMATGSKSYGGSIAVDSRASRLKSIAEIAKEMGKAAGTISSVQFSHATPAGFGAHNASRNNYVEIAQEMLLDSRLDVVMGAGHPLYDNDNQPSDSASDKYAGGIDFYNAVSAGGMTAFEGNEVEDVDGDGAADVWTVVEDKADFQALMTGDTPKRVFGLAKVNGTLQYNRSSSVGKMAFNPEAVVDQMVLDEQVAKMAYSDNEDIVTDPFSDPRNENVPALAEMTAAALNVLDNDPDGFFLHVEAGAVDWAGHGNWMGRMIEEQMEYNDAVDAVIAWVEANSSWDETLVIVTGDHETGLLTGPDARDANANWTPVVNNGQGKLPTGTFNSGSHTNQIIPLFAKGPASNLCLTYSNENCPIRGRYMDNTEIFKVMKYAFTGDSVGVEDEAPIEFDVVSNYPNPFNPATTINYTVSLPGTVRMSIYDVLGRKIDELVDSVHAPGSYAVTWNAGSHASGTYFARIEMYGNKVLNHKMTLLK